MNLRVVSGYPNVNQMTPAEMQAEILSLRDAAKLALKHCDECSDPKGWLATNVRHALLSVPSVSSRLTETK